jgi:hypothetical protein
MRTPMRALPFLSLLATSGCTLLINAELSDKPTQTGGGGGGQGGGGTSSSSVQSSTGPSSSSSGVVCPPNMATCDGDPGPPCNVNLKDDPDNCGSCNDVCAGILPHCAGGVCK